MKNKTKALASSALAIAMSASLAISGTYALFTSEDKVNIAVTSGTVKVEAEIANVQYKTLTADWTNATSDTVTFDNLGGTATVGDDSVTLDKIVPGDGIKFDVVITNYSNVAIQYRAGVVKSADTGLYNGLDIKVNDAVFVPAVAMSWSPLAAATETGVKVETISVEIELPDTGNNTYDNQFQGKTCALDVLVEAVQGNATMPDEWDGTANTAWYNDTDSEFVLDTAEDLAGLSTLVNGGNTFAEKTLTLDSDIDLKDQQWTPIGTEANRFKGTFDGDNHTISNMTVSANTPNANQFAGLFGAVQNAEVKNVTMKDVDIDVTGAKVRAAAIAGFASSDTSKPSVLALSFENITIEGCEIKTEATSSSAMAGGIAGYSYPANMKNVSVSDLKIDGKASGNNVVYASALVGYQCGQNISNNGNTRMAFTIEEFNLKNIEINAEAYTVLAGGYTGEPYYGYITLQDGTIDNIKMTVDAHEAFVGGLVGYFWRSDNGHHINNVHISGIDFDVTTDYLGETRIGGMVGTSQSTATYKDCSVSGKIVEKCADSANPVNYHAKVGGFVARAYTWGQVYENCVADVDVTGSHVAGGFVGNHISSITYTNCQAKGDVTAQFAGGFVGRMTEHNFSTAATFTNCSASGNVNGNAFAGGFIGSTVDYGWASHVGATKYTPYGKTITLKDCVITATVTGNGAVAGVIGEARMKDGVKIVLDNVTCATTPTVLPDDSCIEIATNN